MKLSSLYNDFEEVGIGLERWHGLFYQLWSMGYPTFTDKIKTAAVAFNKKGQFIEFLFNPDFWESLTLYEKEFVISHECVHCLNNHGLRAKALNKDKNSPLNEHELINVAMDITDNHTLVNKFQFDRDKLPNLNKMGIIWKDTVFPNPKIIDDDREFEYYFDKIKKECPKISIPTLDVHGFAGEALPEGYESIPDHILEEIKDKIEDALDEEEFTKGIQAGLISGTEKKKVKRQEKRILQRWEKIIHRWTCKDEAEDDVWTRKNRRMNCLPLDFILPYDGPNDQIGVKVDVVFFQDTSGSCVEFADHFFNAARTFPENFFKIKAFCFDTKVYPIDFKNPTLKGFGGTAFDIIENYINQNLKKYPDAIFIFTDGFGNNIRPQYPERYHIFLEGHSTSKDCFPKTCNFYNLKDFVA